MKKTLFNSIVALTLCLSFAGKAPAQAPDFARGADISWCTEMEAENYKFYNSDGVRTDIFALMKEIGMNTIRLRVWVNPENAYGPWCDKADVVNKAVRANEQGLSVMIDFHYSDFFADPSQQDKPADWSDYSVSELTQAVADHTTDVLSALDSAGVTPVWVQVGNETNHGMLWDDGYLWPSSAGSYGYWDNYVAFNNAAYEAVKTVFPDAIVIVHLADASTASLWWWKRFSSEGGKFDMAGFSHYPEVDTYDSDNTAACTCLAQVATNMGVQTMIVETAVSNDDDEVPYNVMSDLFTKVRAQSGIVGILYWEPEIYNYWKPDYYQSLGWNAWDKGAFYSSGNSAGAHYGSPSAALSAFSEDADTYDDIRAVEADEVEGATTFYNLAGQQVSAGSTGLLIEKSGTSARKILRR